MILLYYNCDYDYQDNITLSSPPVFSVIFHETLLSCVGSSNSESRDGFFCRTKTRSEAEARGDLEVSVMSVKGLDGDSLTDSRGSRGESMNGWVIDDADEATDGSEVATDAKAEMRRDLGGRVGEVVGNQQQKMGILEQKLKFPVFEDQPETLQVSSA